MGRTKRIRQKRKINQNIVSLDNESLTIDLKKWLSQNNWHNETSLSLFRYPDTGRGVTSRQALKAGSALINMPYDVMITYTTVENMGLHKYLRPSAKGTLKMHDLLSFFLMVELHKGCNSSWWHYIKSLPTTEEFPPVPWTLERELFDLLLPELKALEEKARNNYDDSKARLWKSIDSSKICFCTAYNNSNGNNSKTFRDCVFEGDSFTWAYVLVNTRAVYIDPQVVLKKEDNYFLSDNPSMALCPFLDMFNHIDSANTDVTVKNINDNLNYQLRTLVPFKKYEQIFISYGPHDNYKLLVEYGFFLPENRLDTVQFDNPKEVYNILNIDVNRLRYKYITDHGFHDNLEINYNAELSFNLKALLFISFASDENAIRHWQSIIYSDNFDNDFKTKVPSLTTALLKYKLQYYDTYYRLVKSYFSQVENYNLKAVKLLDDFFEYRMQFVEKLITKLI